MPTIRLCLIAADATRRKKLEDIFRLGPEFVIVGGDHPPVQPPFPKVDVFVVDLAHPDAAFPRFWMVLHVLYRGWGLRGVAGPPFDDTTLQAALHAGAYYMVAWTDPAERMS